VRQSSYSACQITVVAHACLIDGEHKVSGTYRIEEVRGEAGNFSVNVPIDDYLATPLNPPGSDTVSFATGGVEQSSSTIENSDTTLWSTHELSVVRPESSSTVLQQNVRIAKSPLDASSSNYSACVTLPDTLFGGQRLFVEFGPEDLSPENGIAQIGQFKAYSLELENRELTISNSTDNPDSLNLVLSVDGTLRQTTISNPE
jgi:hypothetical protein